MVSSSMEKKNPFKVSFFCLIISNVYVFAFAIVKVGVILDMDEWGRMTMTCLSMAISNFYDTHSYYATRLQLVTRDSKGTVIGAAAAGLDLINNVQVQAIMGPVFSSQANFLISLGNEARVPIITFSATSPLLSWNYTPYFIRATIDDSSQVHAIGAIVHAFGWREVVPIYEGNEFGEGIIPYLVDALKDVNAQIPYRSVVSPQATDDQIVAELYKIMTMQTRVFVVHMMSPLASRLFTKAKQLGMMSQDYAWIITDGITRELNVMDDEVKKSMSGVIGVKPYVLSTKVLDNFENQFKRMVQKENPEIIEPELDDFHLWAHDSILALAMAAEEAKLANPKYINDDAIASENLTDHEAFAMPNAGPNLICALLNMRFEGLSGYFSLSEGQLQPPPFQIINIVGNSTHCIGYWTKDNGIVKELKFHPPNTGTYSVSQSQLASITWPGDQWCPPKGWVIPTNGKKLRVGVPVTSYTDFVHVKWNPDNSTKVEGYCIDVFKAVIEELPYGVQYEYIPFATPDRKMAGTYNELTYQVYLQNFDAVVGDVTIVANRSEYVDFTLPYIQSDVSMVVPYTDEKTTWVFLKPLTWELWLTSLCSFVFVGILIWILEHRINEDFRGPIFNQVGMIFWFAFSTMVFAQKEKVISNLARIVLVVWFLAVLILTQSYTASLASMLTVQQLSPAINDVKYLIRNKQPIGYPRDSFLYGLLKKMDFDALQLKPFINLEEMDELLLKGTRNGGIAAAFHEDPYLKFFLRDYGSKYTLVGPLYKANGFAFVFPKDSPLVPDISRAILKVMEGQMVDIERRWLGGTTKYPNCKGLSTTSKNLGLGSLWELFLIVGIVGVIALTIYAFKFLHENWNVIQKQTSTWSKMIELVHVFNTKDVENHTFKKSKLNTPTPTNGCSGDWPCSNDQNPSTSPSIYPSCSPEPNYIFSSQEHQMQPETTRRLYRTRKQANNLTP